MMRHGNWPDTAFAEMTATQPISTKPRFFELDSWLPALGLSNFLCCYCRGPLGASITRKQNMEGIEYKQDVEADMFAGKICKVPSYILE